MTWTEPRPCAGNSRKIFRTRSTASARLAAVLEARGQRPAAAQAYRQAADFMRSHPGFDRESVEDMIQSAERMDAGDDKLPL